MLTEKVIYGCRMLDKQEKEIAEKFGGQLSRASGAVFDDGDIRIKGFLVESKRRDTLKGIYVSNSVWLKIRKQAIMRGRKPLLVYTNKEVRVAILDLEDFKEMYDEQSK